MLVVFRRDEGNSLSPRYQWNHHTATLNVKQRSDTAPVFNLHHMYHIRGNIVLQLVDSATYKIAPLLLLLLIEAAKQAAFFG